MEDLWISPISAQFFSWICRSTVQSVLLLSEGGSNATISYHLTVILGTRTRFDPGTNTSYKTMHNKAGGWQLLILAILFRHHEGKSLNCQLDPPTDQTAPRKHKLHPGKHDTHTHQPQQQSTVHKDPETNGLQATKAIVSLLYLLLVFLGLSAHPSAGIAWVEHKNETDQWTCFNVRS